MNPTSIWDTADGHPSFAPLTADLEVDVAVIGGGITGITTAQLLAQGGLRVAVLEARTVGSGTTGSSAGNLYAPVDEYLHKLIDHWNVEKIRRVIRSRIAAIDLIAANVIRHGIDCDFIRVPWVLYAVGGSHEKCRLVRDEYDAARLLGLPARLWGCLPYVMPVDQALVVPQQAQFDPRRYVEQLAAAVVREPVRGRCEIYEHTPVVHLDAEAGILRTPRHRVRADRIVMATHTPKGFVFQQIEVAPYREYAVAGPLEAKVWPRGIYWSIDEPVYSTRSVRVAGREYLLCIGQKHKVGQQPGTDGNYAQLQSYVRRHFGVSQFDFQWSAQHYRAADGLPYIGRAIGSARVLIATGFATDGLVYGTVAAQVIGDDLL
ncbi:MAG TPA: FAD-dependent oxidoreductase, partial [Burkholderiaceae bacterium]|nr:FAD-dependent oxidoreductase [Burkholderiaceae bacterium]